MSMVASSVIYSAKTSPVPDFLKQQLWRPELVDNALPWFRNYFHIWPDFKQEKNWPNLTRLNALFPAQQEELSFIENPPKQRRRKRKENIIPYDSRIALHREVYTREKNWHDFFNMMIWSILPRSKHTLHKRQHLASIKQLNRELGTPLRNAEQNNLTRFDEGGLILVCAESHRHQLPKSRDLEFISCFSQLILHGKAVLLPMGHAIFETMLSERWRVGAMSILLTVKADTIFQHQDWLYQCIDNDLAEHLNNGVMCSKEQVFGVPLEVAGKWFGMVAERSFLGDKQI